MKTDAELNRLIAERVLDLPRQVTGVTTTPDGFGMRIHYGVVAKDYCTDPAAWGALFVWLAERDMIPELIGRADRSYSAWLMTRPEGLAYQDTPGRALVLATLAAWGVSEVE